MHHYRSPQVKHTLARTMTASLGVTLALTASASEQTAVTLLASPFGWSSQFDTTITYRHDAEASLDDQTGNTISIDSFGGAGTFSLVQSENLDLLFDVSASRRDINVDQPIPAQ